MYREFKFQLDTTSESEKRLIDFLEEFQNELRLKIVLEDFMLNRHKEIQEFREGKRVGLIGMSMRAPL